MKTIKLAIIGFGKSAKRYHLPYIKHKRNLVIKYIYDIVDTQKEEVEDMYPDAVFTTDLNRILQDDEVQLVTLCTPPATHYELAKKCILADKNVIVEKPFCNTVKEAKELIALAKECQLLITPYQNRRFDSDYLTLKEVLHYRYVGKPVEIETHTDYYRPSNEIRKGSSLDGSFYALSIHSIDQMIALYGKPKAVYYDIRNIQNKNSTVDDYYDLHLFYEELKIIIKSSQVVALPYPKYIVHGTNGSYIKYDGDQQENDLKQGIQTNHPTFGIDTVDRFGNIKYRNSSGDWITKKIPTVVGNYGNFYESVYQSIVYQKAREVKEEDILLAVRILEEGLKIKEPTTVWL